MIDHCELRGVSGKEGRVRVEDARMGGADGTEQ